MCLIAFAWNAHPLLPLVIVANRDEFHQRPTAPLAPWEGVPDVLGGRDLREGGGWLALNGRRGRLAAVTNVREAELANAPRSRGALVRDFAGGGDCAVAFSEAIRMDADAYGPFNLVLWDGQELVYATNRPKPRWESLGRGVYGLSNGTLDAPWPKTRRLTAALTAWLAETGAAPGAGLEGLDTAPLFAALQDETRAPDDELPVTGVGLERERFVAPAFIRSARYGTRASSIVFVGAQGDARFIERRFGPGGTPLGTSELATRPGG